MGILLGIVSGFIGALPLMASEKVRKSRLRKDKNTTIWHMVGLVVISFLILNVALLGCAWLGKQVLKAFAIAMLITFVVAVLISTIIRVRRFCK